MIGVSYFAVLALVSGVLGFIVAGTVLFRLSTHAPKVRWSFASISVAGGIWATAYAFQLLSGPLALKKMWANLVWFGAVPVATLWFLFVLAYAGYGRRLSRPVLALLAIEPTLILMLKIGDNPLFIEEYALAGSGVNALAVPQLGPLFYVHLLYTFVLSVVSIVILVLQYVQRDRLYRQQTTILLASGVIIMVSVVLTAAGISPLPALDLTPMVFGVTNAMILLALYRYRLFDVTPVAHSTMFESLRDGVLVVDSNRHVVEANSAANSLVETDGSAVGASLADLVQSDRVADLLDSGGGPVEVEVDTDNEPRFYEVTVTPTAGGKGKLSHWVIVFRDVTERRQTRAYFRSLIESSQDIISVLDTDGTRTYSSPSVRHVLGYDPDELVGSKPIELIHPEDKSRAREAFERAVEGDESVRLELRLRHGDGTWRTFEAEIVDLLDDPVVEGIVVSSREITQRYRYEQRLRVFNRVLRHDIRNEMNVILGYADLMREGGYQPEAETYADIIYEKANKLVDLSEQTRSLDETLGETERRRQPVDVAATVRDRVEAAREQHPEATVRCEVDGEQWAYGDERLGDAVDNLVDNAIVHNDSVQPTVDLSVTTVTPEDDDRSWVELTITDNGPGIPKAERQVITDGIETPLNHVSGIGLWLVTWIVGNANGKLAFEENEPHGSIVTLRLEALTGESKPPSTAGREYPVADDD